MNRSAVLNYMLAAAVAFVLIVVAVKGFGLGQGQGAPTNSVRADFDVKGLQLYFSVDDMRVISKVPGVGNNYPTDAVACVKVINEQFLSQEFFKRENAFVRVKILAQKNDVAYIGFEGDPKIITEQSGSCGAQQTTLTISSNLLMCRDVVNVYFVLEGGSHFSGGMESVAEIWKYADPDAKCVLLPKLLDYLDHESVLDNASDFDECKTIMETLSKIPREAGIAKWREWCEKEKTNLPAIISKYKEE